MTTEELLAEEHICNEKCQDDITRNYVHCKTCTRLNDFHAGFEAGVKHVYDRLREEQLKEVERIMDRVLNALASWKPEVEEDVV